MPPKKKSAAKKSADDVESKKSSALGRTLTKVKAVVALSKPSSLVGSLEGSEVVAPKKEEPAKPTYLGPRPDEELLEAVRLEAEEGRRERIVIQRESVEYVYAMIRSGEDVNQRSATGYHSLSVAAAAGNAELVSLLLERRADPTITNVHRAELPIHLAARGGYDLVCRLLVEPTRQRGVLDAPNVTGWPALHLATACGHLGVLAVLCRGGADINSRNAVLGDRTAAHLAAFICNQDALESLLDREADVRATDRLLRTPLHYAASKANAPGVSLLLRSKSDASARDSDGMTPMQLVPVEHPGRTKILTLLQAFARPPREAPRTDTHFERRLNDADII